jgi:hypothetical protein
VNLRKNMVLAVGGAICAVLILASGYMLFRKRAEYVKVRGQAQAAEARLQQLNQRDPFPSTENVTVVDSNLAALEKNAATILDSLSEGQAPVPAVEAAEFAPMLESAKQSLMTRAAAAGVKFPERFGLGFERYTKGDLPSDEAIPRLVTQLHAVGTVVDLLFDARVTEISEMQREVFEGEPAAAPAATDRRGGATTVANTAKWNTIPLAESNDLYHAERIYVACAGREASIWSLLNAIAAHRPLVVLADFKATNPLGYDARRTAPATAGRAVAPAARGTPAATAAAPKPLDREERIAAGREAIKIELLLDVYQFSTTTPAGGEGQP